MERRLQEVFNEVPKSSTMKRISPEVFRVEKISKYLPGNEDLNNSCLERRPDEVFHVEWILSGLLHRKCPQDPSIQGRPSEFFSTQRIPSWGALYIKGLSEVFYVVQTSDLKLKYEDSQEVCLSRRVLHRKDLQRSPMERQPQ